MGLLFVGSVCLRHVSTGVARVCATAACRLTRVTSGDSSDVVDLYHSASGTWSTARLSVARNLLVATSAGHLAIFAGGQAAGYFTLPWLFICRACFFWVQVVFRVSFCATQLAVS